MHNGFQKVKKKRNRKQKPQYSFFDDDSGFSTQLFISEKLSKALEDFRLSRFSFEVVQAINECLTSINLSSIQEILCYGIGNFTDSISSLHQLSALIEISRHFTSPVKIYDPVFSDFEIKILKELKFEVLEKNEEGKRQISNITTLVFLPHCPKQLVNNFLWANWRTCLNHCMLICNSFSRIIESNTEKVLKESANYIQKIQARTKEIPLQNCYHIENIFNDTSLHYFDSLDLSFFNNTIESEPAYTEGTELITNSVKFLCIKDE